MRNIVVKSRHQQLIEAHTGEPLPDTLRRLYTQDGLTQTEVADRLDVSRQTVAAWMKQFGIESRMDPHPQTEAVA